MVRPSLFSGHDLYIVPLRYRLKLSYNGRPFAGWQIQPRAISVQGVLQEALSRICKTPVHIKGCGRTDAGVHAINYFAHFDQEPALPTEFVRKVNANLPDEISLISIGMTDSNWHARHGAISRKYTYLISSETDPLNQGLSFHFHAYKTIDWNLLQKAADLIKAYDSFKPFCKSHSDAKHHLCEIQKVAWMVENGRMVFTISANRFLRGMVRLIVGMCLNVALGKINLIDVKKSLDNQTPLPMPWSVPASGLFLADVIYPDDSV